jgi:putative addiction module killer protein
MDVRLFQTGDHCPFAEWIDSIKDVRTRAIIRARLIRIRHGNLGDCKPVGDGVHEFRIDFGPGYRVYFGRRGDMIIILLGGGSKKTQRADIDAAKQHWKEHCDAEA